MNPMSKTHDEFSIAPKAVESKVHSKADSRSQTVQKKEAISADEKFKNTDITYVSATSQGFYH